MWSLRPGVEVVIRIWPAMPLASLLRPTPVSMNGMPCAVSASMMAFLSGPVSMARNTKLASRSSLTFSAVTLTGCGTMPRRIREYMRV